MTELILLSFSWLSIGGDDHSGSSFVVNSSMTAVSNLYSECAVAHWTCVCSCSQRVDWVKETLFPLPLLYFRGSFKVVNKIAWQFHHPTICKAYNGGWCWVGIERPAFFLLGNMPAHSFRVIQTYCNSNATAVQ